MFHDRNEFSGASHVTSTIQQKIERAKLDHARAKTAAQRASASLTTIRRDTTVTTEFIRRARTFLEDARSHLVTLTPMVSSII